LFPPVLDKEGSKENKEGRELCLRFLEVVLGALVEVWRSGEPRRSSVERPAKGKEAG
jgi:hypothetical protein